MENEETNVQPEGAEAPETTQVEETPQAEETQATEETATPEESLQDVVRRHAEAEAEPVEQEEAAEEEPAGEEPQAGEENVEEDESEDTSGYDAQTIQTAIAIFEEGEDHPEYLDALGILDDLGMIEYAEDDEEAEEAEDPAELTLEQRLERMEQAEARRVAEAEAAEQAQADRIAEEEAQQEFYSELDKHFAAEGEEFPRDPSNWTEEQSLQARLTASFESGEAAQKALQSYVDSRIEKYVNEKPEAVAPPAAGGQASDAKDTDLSARESIAETARRHLAGSNPNLG